jgi:hypothetical protein
LATGSPQTEKRKRSRRFYLILLATILLIAAVVGAVVFEMFQTPNYGPGPFDIEVTTEKPFYLGGEDVYFVIYVTNPQDWPVPHPDYAEYQIEKEGILIDGRSVSIDFAPDRIPTFPAHSRTPYKPPLVWNQKTDLNGTRVQVQPGNYTLTLTIQGFGYRASGNYTFEIR